MTSIPASWTATRTTSVPTIHAATRRILCCRGSAAGGGATATSDIEHEPNARLGCGWVGGDVAARKSHRHVSAERLAGGERLRLDLVELGLRDRARVEEALGLLDLGRRAASDRLDVGVLRFLLSLHLLD